jgi:hypothetical protein
MGIERSEDIEVQKADNHVIVRTEQTTVFPSLEEARKQMDDKKVKEAGLAVAWSSASVASALYGLSYIIHGVESGDLLETAQGLQVLGLSIAILPNVPRRIRALRAANRILKKIDEMRKTTKLFFVVSSSLLMTMCIRCNGYLKPPLPMVS